MKVTCLLIVFLAFALETRGEEPAAAKPKVADLKQRLEELQKQLALKKAAEDRAAQEAAEARAAEEAARKARAAEEAARVRAAREAAKARAAEEEARVRAAVQEAEARAARAAKAAQVAQARAEALATLAALEALAAEKKVPPPPEKPAELVAATQEAPYINELGMEFLPVPGKPGIYMCRTEVRVQDFRAYVRATGYAQSGGAFVFKDGAWELDNSSSWKKPGYSQGDEHPVTCVNWEEAKGFCAWLNSLEEGLNYRLPSDEEWGAAVGGEKYPWGSEWPVPEGVGNYFAKEMEDEYPGYPLTSEASDAFTRAAPVASFPANASGFYDLGGNLWEWCEDAYKSTMNTADILEEYPVLQVESYSDGTPFRVLRGGSWSYNSEGNLRSAYRDLNLPTCRSFDYGFRPVVEVAPGFHE